MPTVTTSGTPGANLVRRIGSGRGYDLTVDDRLILPCGLRHTVTDIIERAGSSLAVADQRRIAALPVEGV
ncbi:hypothetical protein [Micromonospora inyonensis]|uniref:Uncharacterized protein n=1 Tax=Micromonospora inyonensis TaxID=47866 RepID=A0A1C6RE13_9ACTN|nr:hypothetical protein [Micromonospora inyonensis]SCL15399.1 hypothetical protein GA0074694_1193 [Micromonospora inyonensis]